MERILLIGCPGAGKTTFAAALAEKLQLPLVHLDRVYWRGNWEHLSREEFDAVLQQELEKPQWILDGNYNRTLPHRLQYCDTVFFFDFSTVQCLAGITQRTLGSLGKQRPDMGGNCVERFDRQKISLYRSVLRFRREHIVQYYSLLETTSAQVIVFRNRRQVRKYLKQLNN